MTDAGRYHAAVTTQDVWICYPWEATYVHHYFIIGSFATFLVDVLY
jgi:hypothetical protein